MEEPKLRKIDANFGEGKYVSWKDGDTKKALIANWGVYDKPDDEGNNKIAFRCDVLKLDGTDYPNGTKIIDTTSVNFHKAIKPFLNKTGAVLLEITRIGEKKKTAFKIKEIK